MNSNSFKSNSRGTSSILGVCINNNYYHIYIYILLIILIIYIYISCVPGSSKYSLMCFAFPNKGPNSVLVLLMSAEPHRFVNFLNPNKCRYHIFIRKLCGYLLIIAGFWRIFAAHLRVCPVHCSDQLWFFFGPSVQTWVLTQSILTCTVLALNSYKWDYNYYNYKAVYHYSPIYNC